MVSEVHDNIYLVSVIKRFLNISVHVFPVKNEIVQPKERRFLKVEAPFSDEISGLGIIK